MVVLSLSGYSLTLVYILLVDAAEGKDTMKSVLKGEMDG